MWESVKLFTLAFISPATMAHGALRGLASYFFDGHLMGSSSDKTPRFGGKAKKPHSDVGGTTTIEDFTRVAVALARFQQLHCDDRPHSPEELRIIETPLGFEPH
jgi:hypothetical protein